MRRAPRKTALAAFSLVLLAAPPASAEPRPAPEKTLAAAKRAAGGEAWRGVRTLHAIGKIEIGGLSGRLESWIDVRTGRYADRFDLGPASFAQGFDGERAWSADTSGQARIDDSSDAREIAANEAYRRSFSFWIPGSRHAARASAGSRSDAGKRFRIVRLKPDGGRPFELWIDAATSLVGRIVEADSGQTTTTSLADYRPVAGVLLPRAIRVTNGQPKYDQVIALETIEANTELAPAVFALPPPPPPDFSFANGATSTTVPFEIVNDHIALDVRINGRGPHRIYCDTGGSNVITPAVAKTLGIPFEGSLEGTGVGEHSADVSLAKIDTIEIGDATIRRQIFAVFDLSSLEPVEGGPIPGLVGYEIFKRFVVTIDYAKKRLTLTLPSAFRYDGRGVVVPFSFHGSKPQVQGSIDGVPGTFDIDTGSRASLDLSRPFVEDHDLVRRYAARVECISGWGVGGPVRSLLARAGVLTLGAVELPGVVALLSRQQSGSFADRSVSGNVGAGILRRFTLTFDYAGKNIVFEKNGSFDEPDGYDRAGIWINAAPGGFDVVDVVAGGPSWTAGVRPGDRITAVDGEPAATSLLSEFRRRLRTDPPGTPVRLTVASPTATGRDVVIVLRDLV